jgi:hypothetical protein
MTTQLGVLSISLLLLGLAVSERLARPLTVVGLMGLVLLRLFATARGRTQRRSVVRPASRERHTHDDAANLKRGRSMTAMMTGADLRGRAVAMHSAIKFRN